VPRQQQSKTKREFVGWLSREDEEGGKQKWTKTPERGKKDPRDSARRKSQNLPDRNMTENFVSKNGKKKKVNRLERGGKDFPASNNGRNRRVAVKKGKGKKKGDR